MTRFFRVFFSSLATLAISIFIVAKTGIAYTPLIVLIVIISLSSILLVFSITKKSTWTIDEKRKREREEAEEKTIREERERIVKEERRRREEARRVEIERRTKEYNALFYNPERKLICCRCDKELKLDNLYCEWTYWRREIVGGDTVDTFVTKHIPYMEDYVNPAQEIQIADLFCNSCGAKRHLELRQEQLIDTQQRTMKEQRETEQLKIRLAAERNVLYGEELRIARKREEREAMQWRD